MDKLWLQPTLICLSPFFHYKTLPPHHSNGKSNQDFMCTLETKQFFLPVILKLHASANLE